MIFNKLFIGFTVLILVLSVEGNGQDPSHVIGSVSREEFESPIQPYEKGAEAIVLFDYATAKMIFKRSTNEDQTGFKIEFNRHVRIRILKSSGYDYANIALDYSKDDILGKVTAYTHNLENNEVVSLQLKNNQFSTEKTNDYYFRRRFTFPQVREGSIIEYSYTYIKGDIWEYMPFVMQRDIPVRYAEYQAVYPEYFVYTIKRNGNKLIQENFSSQKGYFNTSSTNYNIYKWTGKNIPSFQKEPYLPAVQEYMAGIQFELAAVNIPGASEAFASPTYKRFTERLYLNDAFGRYLDSPLLFAALLKNLTNGLSDNYLKMEAIYKYLANNMKWDNQKSFLLSKTPEKALREKRGNSADINLMLVIMLRNTGIQADPVILSTRDHGTMNKVMAYEGNFNYVVCLATVNGKEYLLDATDKSLPPGTLPEYCLNGEGWIVSENRGRFIKLLTKENNTYAGIYDINLMPDGTLQGTVNLQYDGYAGLQLKKDINNMGIEEYKLNELSDFGLMTFSSLSILNADQYDKPLSVSFNIQTNELLQSSGNICFFNPFDINIINTENPFVKEVREFPVDLGCPLSTSFKYSIKIPGNFSVEEIPGSLQVTTLDDAAQFTFSSSVKDNILTLQGVMQISKTTFIPDEYKALREFYTQYIKKLNEMIILKRMVESKQ